MLRRLLGGPRVGEINGGMEVEILCCEVVRRDTDEIGLTNCFCLDLTAAKLLSMLVGWLI